MQKLGTKPGNSKMIGVRLTDKQIKYIDSLNQSKSEFIRGLVDKHMKFGNSEIEEESKEG
jgi:hypothetical protein